MTADEKFEYVLENLPTFNSPSLVARFTAIMGRKKKFVDRNAATAHNFQVVYRSQHDMRIADEESSQYVLQPVVPLNVSKKQKDQGQESYHAAEEALNSIYASSPSKAAASDDAVAQVDASASSRAL